MKKADIIKALIDAEGPPHPSAVENYAKCLNELTIVELKILTRMYAEGLIIINPHHTVCNASIFNPSTLQVVGEVNGPNMCGLNESLFINRFIIGHGQTRVSIYMTAKFANLDMAIDMYLHNFEKI